MTYDQITHDLEKDEAATLADTQIRNMARAALALAIKTAPGSASPNPALPGSISHCRVLTRVPLNGVDKLRKGAQHPFRNAVGI